MSAIAPALVDFASWVADIGGRLIRGQIDEQAALAELKQRAADCDAEIATAMALIKDDRARVDARVAGLPHAPPASAVTTPPIIPPAPAAAVPPQPSGAE